MSDRVKNTLQYDISEQELSCDSTMHALFANRCNWDKFEQSGS